MSRTPDYFSGKHKDKNIQEIKKISANRILPFWQSDIDGADWMPLFPAPADALIFPEDQEDYYIIDSFSYENAFFSGGVDISWKNWLLPNRALVQLNR